MGALSNLGIIAPIITIKPHTKHGRRENPQSPPSSLKRAAIKKDQSAFPPIIPMPIPYKKAPIKQALSSREALAIAEPKIKPHKPIKNPAKADTKAG